MNIDRYLETQTWSGEEADEEEEVKRKHNIPHKCIYSWVPFVRRLVNWHPPPPSTTASAAELNQPTFKDQSRVGFDASFLARRLQTPSTTQSAATAT